MNNDTKSANIMTWSKFKKLFNPQRHSVQDSVFGKQYVHPTMTSPGLKFNHIQVTDIDEHYGYGNKLKPLDIVKDKLDVFKYNYIVYYTWRHRDFHGKGIDIYYI